MSILNTLPYQHTGTKPYLPAACRHRAPPAALPTSPALEKAGGRGDGPKCHVLQCVTQCLNRKHSTFVISFCDCLFSIFKYCNEHKPLSFFYPCSFVVHLKHTALPAHRHQALPTCSTQAPSPTCSTAHQPCPTKGWWARGRPKMSCFAVCHSMAQ